VLDGVLVLVTSCGPRSGGEPEAISGPTGVIFPPQYLLHGRDGTGCSLGRRPVNPMTRLEGLNVVGVVCRTGFKHQTQTPTHSRGRAYNASDSLWPGTARLVAASTSGLIRPGDIPGAGVTSGGGDILLLCVAPRRKSGRSPGMQRHRRTVYCALSSDSAAPAPRRNGS
jgi:hypothetical protein